jgi:hypothetical protein
LDRKALLDRRAHKVHQDPLLIKAIQEHWALKVSEVSLDPQDHKVQSVEQAPRVLRDIQEHRGDRDLQVLRGQEDSRAV